MLIAKSKIRKGWGCTILNHLIARKAMQVCSNQAKIGEPRLARNKGVATLKRLE